VLTTTNKYNSLFPRSKQPKTYKHPKMSQISSHRLAGVHRHLAVHAKNPETRLIRLCCLTDDFKEKPRKLVQSDELLGRFCNTLDGYY